MSSHADTIREACARLIAQDRFGAPYADAAESALDALLADNQQLREDYRRIADLRGEWRQIAEAALRIARSHAGIVASSDAAVVMSSQPDTAKQIAEEAWQLNQRFLHADYIGDEPGMFQLRRDLAFLSLLVHQLAAAVEE